jgi:SRSO17 transposase
MDAVELRGLLPEMETFVKRFADCFSDRRSREHLPVYLRGQLSDLDRKSVEPIALRSGVPPRTLQEFLSHLAWDQQRLRDRVQEIVAAEHLGLAERPVCSVGLLDETSFVKKGTKTPGVQRQWCGHLGKVENCVVTVHLGIAAGEFQSLLDGDLFLPESWDQDRERCRAAGIPDDLIYRPKWRIALEQYDRAIAQGIRFDWLTFDEGYGGKPEFLRELTGRKQKWVAEVPRNVYGWLTEPVVTTRPRRKSSRGRVVTKARLVKGETPARRLDQLLARNPKLRDQPWQRYRLDDRERGPSVWEVKRVRIILPNEQGLPGDVRHLLVARHVLTKGEVKYFLCDAPADTPTETLLWVALTRHRVERCFQDLKSELGLDHYEGRTYVGLMRHLVLTLVSNLFLMRAVLRRRGEKSGVDRAPNPPRHRSANHRQVA